MSEDRQFKVCGLTRLQDAEAAAAAGAAYLGFNFYEKSPRYLSVEAFEALRPDLPELTNVAVLVLPDLDFIERLKAAGFDHFQIHFPADRTGMDRLADWEDAVGEGTLWLAPKRAPDVAFDLSWLRFGHGILWDAYDRNAYGGTGKVSDWEAFRELSREYPRKKWVLAGGLSPDNLEAAAAASGSSVFDFASGLESSPGIKDPQRIAAVGKVLRELA